MKKLLPALLTLLLLAAILPKQAEASHVMGSDITWKCLGNDSFLITMTVYRDCNGITLSPGSLSITGDGCSFSIGGGLTSSSPVDITPTCQNSCTRCSNSGCQFPYGIHQYTTTAIVDFSNTSCCEFKLSWSMCCRNGAIGTGAANENYYIEAYMNICDSACNSSPRFTNPPVAILCAGQCFVYNQGVVDDDGDSLVYSFGKPLTGANSPTSWTSPYSYDKPLFFNGFPNANLPFNPPLCRGFHLDSFSGDLMFRPMQAQVTVMAIKVEEYRDGVKIGQITRDLQIIVMNCPPNSVPLVSGIDNTGSFATTACPGEALCFDVYTQDQDQSDTVTLSWNGGIPGGTFTTTNTRTPTGTFCWTPTEADVSTIPYYFTVTAQDDACPVKATTIRSYRVTVKPLPEIEYDITNNGCGSYTFDVTAASPNSSVVNWSGAGGINFQNVRNFTHQFPRGGTYPIEIEVIADCTRRYYDTLVVPNFTVVDIGSDTVACEGTTFTLAPSVSWGKAASFQWHAPVGDTTPSIDVTITQDTGFALTIIDTVGCSNTDSITVRMNKPPDIDLGADLRICASTSIQVGPQITFRDSLDSTLSYEWFRMGESTPFFQDSLVTLDSSATYILSARDSLGCADYDTVRLDVNPAIDIYPPNPEICLGDTVTVSAYWTNNSAYRWYEVSSNQLISTDTAITVWPIATTTYRVVVTETIGGVTCEQSDTVTVEVKPLPNIGIQSLPKNCVDGNVVTLRNYVTPITGTWSGPGVVNNNFRPDQAGAGTHLLQYQYTDQNTGCSNQRNASIVVHPLPNPQVAPTDSICTNEPAVQLMGSPPGGTWAGPGITGSVFNYQFNPKNMQAGVYALIYTFTDGSTNCTNYDTMRMTVVESPEPKIELIPSLCVGAAPVTLEATPAGGTWSGNPYINGNTFNPMVPGFYTVKYTVTAGGICTETDSTFVTVHPLPNVEALVSGNVYSFCSTDAPVALAGSPAGGTWTGTGISGTNFDPGVAGAGSHTLTYSYTNNNGCANVDDTVVTVQQMPEVSIQSVPLLCKGEVFTLEATYSDAAGIIWSGGSGYFGDTTAEQTTYTPAGQDLVDGSFEVSIRTVPVVNNVCPAATDQQLVEMHPDPQPAFTSDVQAGCQPLEVNFVNESSVEGGSIARYRWSFGDGDTSSAANPTHVYPEVGTYDVRLWVESNEGCSEEIVKPEYVQVYLVPEAAFSVSPEYTTIALPTVSFTDESSSTEEPSYRWYFDDYMVPDGGVSSERNPSYTYTDTGRFQVALVVTNANGCSDTAINEAIVDPDVSVFIPSAFTPGDMGPEQNDVFKPAITGSIEYRLQIYNRWGELLYESLTPDKGWDGTHQGMRADEGVYVYVIRVLGFDGEVYKYSGTVTLLQDSE